MVSKIKQAMDILEFIPEATTNDIIDISQKLQCSERWVWKAKARLEVKRKKRTEKFRQNVHLCSLLNDLYTLFRDFTQYMYNCRDITPKEKRLIIEINKQRKEFGYEVDEEGLAL